MRTAFISLIAVAVAGCAVSSAEPESSSSDALIEGPTYQQTIDTVANPYCAAHGKFGTFPGVAGVPIAYAAFEQPNERGAIVLMPGRTETYLKYCEVVYDLRNSGYSIYAMDERGQGLSGRMLPDPEKGYVKDFDDYVTDMETFTRTIAFAKPHAKKYLLAHSMGGAIATLFLEKHQDAFDAAVLSSPMYQINTAPYAEWEAYSIVTAEDAVFLGSNYVLGKGPYDPNETFETNTVTGSRDRWTMNHLLWLAHPTVQLGGPANLWLQKSIEGMWKARWSAASLTTPTLLFQAGKDQIVVTPPQDEVCKNAAHCTKIAFPTAQHEILQETDDIRNAALSATTAFFAAY